MIQLKPGTILRDRYRIAGLIGKGGMGAVYLAEDTRLKGRRCALKEQVILDSTLARLVRNQFEQEASLLARLDHPGLPKVSDYFTLEDNSRDYLVMDYVPGQNLEQILKKAQHEGEYLDEETVLGWINQLCDILRYLHSQDPIVLHRDIKPANIKLTPDNRVKLVDFGLAKPFDPHDPRTITGLQGLGSLPYTPLEQYIGNLGYTDERTDLYALGATCYHLLTGQPAASAHARFLSANALKPPQELNPHLSTHVSEAIMWAMQPHPNDRASSVAIWQEALQRRQIPQYNDLNSPSSNTGQTQTQPQDFMPSKLVGVWFDVLRDNVLLIGISFIVLILALLVTFGI